MRFNPCREDFIECVRKMSYSSADSLPLSFMYGDRLVRGIPEDFHPTEKKRIIDANITETVITGVDENGFEIRAEIYEYRDFPVVEYTVYFTDHGKEDTPILSLVNAIDADFCGSEPILVHGNGDDCTENGYKFFDDPIVGEGIKLSTDGSGNSCSGAFPYMRLKFSDFIITAAIGWSGAWHADFIPNELGIRFAAGQKYTSFKIRPGETMRTPRICLMISSSDDETRAMNMWRHFYSRHIMPKQWGENIPPKACMHVFNYKSQEFTGATEDNQIFGLREYIRRGVKPDLWWYDAGFYKCNGNWTLTGTWKEDKSRWPNNGMSGLSTECEKHGVDLMVWFEPERAVTGSELDTEHPEFLFKVYNNGKAHDFRLLNLGNPEAREWIFERIDSLIKKWRINIYRQDFNMAPLRYWLENEEEDRVGANENLHIQGYYAYWDALLFSNPGLVIDSCASGGRRNDLETMRRAVPFQYTDIGLGDHALKQRHHLMMFEWIPYFRAHTFDNLNGLKVDEISWLNAFAPAVTFTTPAWGDETEFEIARKMLPIWRHAAELELSGDYYPQMKTKYGEELTTFFVTHFYDSDKDEGFALFIRNCNSETEEFTAHLALCEDLHYTATEAISGKTVSGTGKELNDFTVKLGKREGEVWFFSAKK